jgi:aminopeptidase N
VYFCQINPPIFNISAPEPTKTPFALSMELLEGDGGYALCFPGLELKLQYTVEKTQQQMDFVVNHVNAAYPFSSFKLVFVDECYTSVMTGAGIIICSNHLLVSPDIIDQVYVTSKLICRGIVAQWFGHFIVPKAWYIKSQSFGY